MKDITISIDDDVYRAASEEAARQRKSLSELVRELLTKLRREREPNGKPLSAELESPATAAADADEELRKRDEGWHQFLDELNAKPRQDGSSIGPLNREELYERGQQIEPEVPVATAAEEAEFNRRRAELVEFFAGLKAVQAAEPRGDEAQRAELLLRFQPLMERALERDRYKKGPLVPLTREEIYAERLDRIR